MKKIIALIILATSSITYADCVIKGSHNSRLGEMIQKDGWYFENFNELCEELKQHDLGVHITQMEFISDAQTTVTTSVRMYPQEIYSKYGRRVLSDFGHTSMSIHPEKTTLRMEKLKYEDANNALNGVMSNKVTWNEMLDQMAYIRKYIGLTH